MFSMITITARSDVIYEPENDFYLSKKSECVRLNRGFYANGHNGVISLKTEPGGSKEITLLKNGEIIYISHTYNKNGEIWGLTGIYPWKNQTRTYYGWVRMDQLLLAYDFISFEEEYGHEFYDFDGSPDALIEAEKIVFWTWPGAGVFTRVLGPPQKERIFDTYFDSGSEQIKREILPHAYMDSEGREWVFISDYMKYDSNVWVCLSNPSNTDIPVFNAEPEPTLWKSDVVYPAPEPQAGLPLLTFIIILVAALVVITAVLIRVFWKKNAKKP
jgi:hypothetical protein